MKHVKKTSFILTTLLLVMLLGTGFSSCNNVKDSDLEETANQIIANSEGATDVSVTVTDKVATLTGVTQTDVTKLRLESSILAIEGINSVVNNIRVVPPAPPVKVEPEEQEPEKTGELIVATRKGKLNVHSKPGVQELVIAVVDHGETLTLVEKTSDDWWLIKTDTGLEGYCYSPYLEEQ